MDQHKQPHPHLNVVRDGQMADPWPNLIWKYHYKFDWEKLKDRVYTHIKNANKTTILEHGDSESSIGNTYNDRVVNWPEMQDFIKWLEPVFEFQWRHHGYIYQEKRIAEVWFNRHGYGGETLEHHHNGIGLVLTAYLQLPPDSGFIQFRDPLEYHKSNSPIIPENHLWRSIPCETNDILIFPGWLKHKTEPSMNLTEDRVVMTMNIR
jgi:Putative 2OG-Fe(II) oxygenase